MILCTGDNNAVYKISDIILKYDKHDDFANKNEEFYNPSIKKILVTINGMPHQVYVGGLEA